MEASTPPKMLQQAEKILLEPVRPHLIAYCPTMDLIAVVSEEENLDVYRISGQRAFGMRRKNANSSIDYICWKFNGQSIAIAWSDGLVDILSAETGKLLQKDMPLPSESSGSSRISCIGWGVNFIDVDAVKTRTGVPKKKQKQNTVKLELTTDDWDTFKDDTTMDDFLQRQPDLQALDMAPDLPNQLALMDNETLLPKLPPIPLPPASPFARPRQADEGAFNTQAQVDAIFHSHHLQDTNAVDTLIRCTDDGTINPTLYDSLKIVNVRLPSDWPMDSYRPLLHTSHPYSCSHELLMEINGRGGGKKLALVPLTLGFIQSAGIYLHLIASKTTQLQNLLAYIDQCLERIGTFYHHSRDLPSKFIRNISETLEEKKQADLVTNLYHLACTGHCPPLIKEWLTDELAEAGHKRWDHAVTTNTQKLLDLLHENFLPALDRCSLVLSRLRGLVQYSDSSTLFNVPVGSFTAILEVLKCLRLLGHTVLLYAGDTKRQFAAFSKWLRYLIDLQQTTPGSQSREEMENRDPGVDLGLLLEYIQYNLTKCDLEPYLKKEEELPGNVRGNESIGYDDTRKAVELLKQGGLFKEEALCLQHVNGHLSQLCKGVFERFSEWQAGSTSMRVGLVLEEGEVSEARDMRIVYEAPGGEDEVTTYTAVVMKENSSRMHLHRLTHTPIFDAIPASIHTAATSILSFPSSAQVLDVKFADDTALLVLLRAAAERKSYILSIPYASTDPSSSTTTPAIPFTDIPTPSIPTAALPSGSPYPRSTTTSGTLDLGTTEKLTPYVKHVFDSSSASSDKFQPVKMVVNGRKGRRVVVVVEESGRRYRVLDLDYREGEKKEEVKGEDMEDGDGSSDIDMMD